MRAALLLRMRAAAIVGTEGLRSELERHLALHREQLAEYLAIEERDFPAERRRTEPDRLRHLVLRGGVDLERFWVEWLTGALAELGRPEA